MTDDQSCRERRATADGAPDGVVRIPLETILKGAREVLIVHNGEDYRLRVTSRGKLILTK